MSSAVVSVGLAVMFNFKLGLLGAILIVAAQSIAGVNAHNTPIKRITIAFKVSLIFLLVVLMADLCRNNLWYTSLAMLLLAFLFSFLKQYFPINWPDMVIPAAALFLMSYIYTGEGGIIRYTALGCGLGILTELLVVIGLMLLGKRYTPMKPLDASQRSPTYYFLRLKRENFRYAVELATLLIISGYMMHLTPFPHSYWAPLTIIMVVQVGNQGAVKRIGQRLLGTLIGCVIGALVLLLTGDIILLLVTIVVLVYFWQYYIRQNYMMGSIFVTAFVLVLLGLEINDPLFLAMERLSFSALGGLMALTSAAIVTGK
ncbi:FUSC family protein [Olivibacter sp. SDN3]|uniref:FUSC family protein n=1 Tax=Olivibacter sp. SDN3 TaxID=2764720 RepID=UPI001650DA13|nr:FUSC family protein [Olivibacter sp. SDN3]QNL52322.1 FUSC family protein [Olivibacter sp. SDN3]